MEKVHTYGRAKHYTRAFLKMEKGMVMEFGAQAKKTMINMKDNMLRTIKMDMEFINGQMELFIKAHSKMI